MRRAARFVVTLVVLIAAGCAILWFTAKQLAAPAFREIGPPPPALQARQIQLLTADDIHVSGWWSPGRPGQGAVLLLHGVRGDRRQMLQRALLLHRQGRGALLIDLPSHGESGGAAITFGLRESEAVVAALEFLDREAPCERRAVIGVSLGAASTVLAKDRPPLDAVVLESMYPTIDEAVADRLKLHLGEWAGALSPLLLAQFPLQLGISPQALRPIDRIAKLRAPLLVIAGARDQHTTVAETRRLYEAALEPKALWIVPGAAHVDLLDYAPEDYATRVSAFLADRLAGTRCAVVRAPAPLVTP
ncbi:alpha/beta hydrolase [Roseateles chitosanitabidus]|uniref:alpha/beta hydrolase n=1 Tax=Roseateles chitosanitabidus TaxID=65048 RepID=UPI000A047720|nr:alpha/beta fold hydrolase [Roseateles chitosanitabidus]